MGYIKEVIKALSRGRKIIKMSREELLALDDGELYEAVAVRIAYDIRWEKADNYAEFYKGAKQVFYVIRQYDTEVNNGGLCQYFVNTTRLSAPYLLENLTKLGVSGHIKLLSDFLTTNNIDVNDLERFAIKDLSKFQELNESYPFDDFDNAFYKLYADEPLNKCLIEYVRQHIEEFA